MKLRTPMLFVCLGVAWAPLLPPGLVDSFLSAQPRLVVQKPFGYQVGDVIEPDVYVVDKDLQKRPLLSLFNKQAKAVVLILLGGSAKTTPSERPHRGPLWCEDSFDDLSVQRALVSHFRGQPVQFVAIAVPPVFNSAPYGFPRGVFLRKGEEDPEFVSNAKEFIAATEKQKAAGLLPFPDLFYDPKFRLGIKADSDNITGDYGPAFPWQGKLKWHLDLRLYGLPAIWVVGPQGSLLREPFFANDYDSDPPQLLYEFKDLKEAIDELLEGSR